MWLRWLRRTRDDRKRDEEVEQVVKRAQEVTDRIEHLRQVTEEEVRRFGGKTT